MPALKPISGHTSCRGPVRYLTRGGRALAEDYINCSRADELGRPVWRQMDDTRAMHGNDVPHHGRAARTYEHFILSPDPRDRVDLATLRELATGWAGRYFGDYECAIFYHDDNALGIPHAHVVVNNTNLDTGRRLSPSLTPTFEAEIWEGLQGMAAERGLRGFEPVSPRAGEAMDANAVTAQRDYRAKEVREIARDGRPSWVEDVRARADCACRLADDPAGFERACRVMGLDVTRTRKGDYLFRHPASETWRVSGGRLGARWTPLGVERRLASERARHVPKPEGERLAAIERAIHDLSRVGPSPMVLGTVSGHDVTARDVSEMLATVQGLGLRSTQDFRDAADAERDAEARGRILRDMRLSIRLDWLPREPDARDGSWASRRNSVETNEPQVDGTPWAPHDVAAHDERGRER